MPYSPRHVSTLGSVLLLVASCAVGGTPAVEGTRIDEWAEPAPLSTIWPPDEFGAVTGNETFLGAALVRGNLFDGFATNVTCALGDTLLINLPRSISEVTVENGDLDALRDALGSPSGHGFVGLDGRDAMLDALTPLTNSNVMSVMHVRRIDVARLVFAGTPSLVDEPSCTNGYAGEILLGARYGFGYRFEFLSEAHARRFRESHLGADLERIIQEGVSSADLDRAGLTRIALTVVRIGGEELFGPDPAIETTCSPEDVYACLIVIDELRRHADGFFASLDIPHSKDARGWAAVRTNVWPMDQTTGDLE